MKKLYSVMLPMLAFISILAVSSSSGQSKEITQEAFATVENKDLVFREDHPYRIESETKSFKNVGGEEIVETRGCTKTEYDGKGNFRRIVSEIADGKTIETEFIDFEEETFRKNDSGKWEKYEVGNRYTALGGPQKVERKYFYDGVELIEKQRADVYREVVTIEMIDPIRGKMILTNVEKCWYDQAGRKIRQETVTKNSLSENSTQTTARYSYPRSIIILSPIIKK